MAYDFCCSVLKYHNTIRIICNQPKFTISDSTILSLYTMRDDFKKHWIWMERSELWQLEIANSLEFSRIQHMVTHHLDSAHGEILMGQPSNSWGYCEDIWSFSVFDMIKKQTVLGNFGCFNQKIQPIAPFKPFSFASCSTTCWATFHLLFGDV